MKTMLLIAMTTGVCVAETIRLPAQYTLTTTTYSTLTGITVDEKSKDKLKTVPIDIKKVLENGTASLVFEKKPSGSIDKTEVVSGRIPYEDKGELVTALLTARKKVERASMKKVDITDDIYKSDTFKAVFVQAGIKATVQVTLGDKDSAITTTLELTAPQIGQLVDVIKKQ